MTAIAADERDAWWARARELVQAQGGPGGKEKLLAQVALEWAVRSSLASPSDRLFAVRPAAWVMVTAGGVDPLARSLLERAAVNHRRQDSGHV